MTFPRGESVSEGFVILHATACVQSAMGFTRRTQQALPYRTAAIATISAVATTAVAATITTAATVAVATTIPTDGHRTGRVSINTFS